MATQLDAWHALYVGRVLGIALRHGLPATPVLDDAGNYTDTIRIAADDEGAISLSVVVPPPPEDWKP